MATFSGGLQSPGYENLPIFGSGPPPVQGQRNGYSGSQVNISPVAVNRAAIRMHSLSRTDENLLGLGYDVGPQWPHIEEHMFESYWGDLWHKEDVSIWFYNQGMRRVVDQTFQWFTTNAAQRRFLQQHRPDIWSFYRLEGRSEHYAGTVFEHLYYEDDYFRTTYWLKVDYPSTLAGYCWRPYLESNLSAQPTLYELENAGWDMTLPISHNGITGHVDPDGIPCHLLRSFFWLRVGMKTAVAPNGVLLCACTDTWCQGNHNCGDAIPCLLPSCIGHEWNAHYCTSIEPAGPPNRLTIKGDWLQCDLCERTALWAYTLRDRSIENRCSYHSNSNTTHASGKIRGERVISSVKIQNSWQYILFQDLKACRDGVIIAPERVDCSYDIAMDLLFHRDGSFGFLLERYLGQKQGGTTRKSMKMAEGHAGAKRQEELKLDALIEKMNDALFEAAEVGCSEDIVNGMARTFIRSFPPCKGASRTSLASYPQAMEGGYVPLLSNGIAVRLPRSGKNPDPQERRVHQEKKQPVVQTQAHFGFPSEPPVVSLQKQQENQDYFLEKRGSAFIDGYCYLAFWKTLEEQREAAAKFGAWPRASTLPREFRRQMQVNSACKKTHITGDGLRPFHYQHIGGQGIWGSYPETATHVRWYGKWLPRAQVCHLASLREAVKCRGTRRALMRHLRILGVNRNDFHPCLMYKGDDDDWNRFGTWLHTRKFMEMADRIETLSNEELCAYVKKHPSHAVIWFMVGAGGPLTGLAHVFAKATLGVPVYVMQRVFLRFADFLPVFLNILATSKMTLTTWVAQVKAKSVEKIEAFNRYACLTIESAKEVIEDVAEHMQDFGHTMVGKVKVLSEVPRNRWHTAKDHVKDAYSTLSAMVEPPISVVRKVSRWMGRYGIKTRERIKVAWAPLLPYRVPNKLSAARTRLTKTGRQEWVKSSYEEALDWHARLLASPLDCDPHTLIDRTELVREFNGNPYHDIHLSYNRKHHPLFDSIPEGIDGLELASAEALWQSMERYGPRDDPKTPLTEEERDNIASALYWQNPRLYAHSNLLNSDWATRPKNLRKIIKNLNASAGIPLLHLKTKKDMWKTGTLQKAAQAGVDLFYADQIYPSVVHVFPKSYVVARHKIDPAQGGSLSNLRTILGVPVHIQVRGRIINGDINDRRDPWHSPGKPGMPLTGSAFNRLYQDAERFNHHYSLDGTKYDSTVARQIMNISTRIRKLGYAWHPDYERIASVLDVMEQSLMEAHLVNLWAKPGSPKRTMWKFGGLMTGHESVTEDNTETLQIVIIATLCKIWNMSPQEVLGSMALENVGDDNFFHCSEPLDEEAFCRTAYELSGVTFRIEDRSTKVTGIEFLSKTGFPMTPEDLQELESYGIDTSNLKYKATHNRKTLLMRYAGLKQDGMHRRKAASRDPFTRAEYMLDRINGYAQLCAHHPDIYQFLREERDWYLGQIKQPVVLERLRKMRKLKMPSYSKIMRQWYAPLNIPMSTKGLVPVWLAYWDAYNLAFYNVDRNLRALRSSLNSLDPEFWDLPDIPLYDLPVKAKGWKPTFQVEEFIFWRNTEYDWQKTENGSLDKCAGIPLLKKSDMVALARQSPFFGCTDIELFCRHKMPRLQEKLLAHPNPTSFVVQQSVKWRFRMSILSIIYSGLALSVSAIPAGATSLFGLFFDLYNSGTRRLYSWLSYAYWLDRGRGNAVISNMVPKDQYGGYKQAAVHLLALVPEQLSLPDLLPFLRLDMGRWLEQTATFVNYVQGFMTPASYSIYNAMSEAGLKGSEWRTITDDFLTVLKTSHNKALILDAPTGTGKTYFFPQFVRESQHVLPITFHIILVPTRILLQEVNIPGAIKASRAMPWLTAYTGGTFIMTYGYAKAIWARLSVHMAAAGPNRVLFQLDELHFEQPQQLWLNQKIRLGNFWRVISTATPSFNILREKFDVFKAPLRQRHTIQHLCLPVNGNSCMIADQVLKNNQATLLGLNKRILIVEPSEAECDKIAESLRAHAHEYSPHFSINVVSRTRKTIPKKGHIVITQMGRAGITIDGVTCVIGSHEIASHYGTVQHRPLSYASMVQEKGRTGRTNDGVYIQTKPGLSSSIAVEVSDPLDCLEHIDVYNTEGDYKFSTPLIKNSPDNSGIRINSWLAHDSVKPQQLESLRIFLQILHGHYGDDPVKALTTTRSEYVSLRNGHCPRNLEHIMVEDGDLIEVDEVLALIPGVHGFMPHGKVYGTLNFKGRRIVVGTFSPLYLPDRGKPVVDPDVTWRNEQSVIDFFESLIPLTNEEIKDEQQMAEHSHDQVRDAIIMAAARHQITRFHTSTRR